MDKILNFALGVVNMMPAIMKGVSGAMDAYNAGKQMLEAMASEKRPPTDMEQAWLDSETVRLRTALHTDDPDEGTGDAG